MNLSSHQHTVIALFIVIIILRLYQGNKFGTFWAALNGSSPLPAAKPAPTTIISITPNNVPQKPTA